MRITRGGDGMLTYQYAVGRDIRCRFHTLAEVGAPFQPAARRILCAKLSANPVTGAYWVVQYGVLIDRAPWVADFATRRKGQQFTR